LYADGSNARDILLGSLYGYGEESINAERSQVVDMELLSMRHQDMDKFSDMAWFRNVNVSKSRSLALSDEYCYQESLKQFEQIEPILPMCIHLYHTGFQPAIIGFYRAFAKMKNEGKINGLSVIPQYFDGIRYQPGTVWY
jgi:hypothetical protein